MRAGLSWLAGAAAVMGLIVGVCPAAAQNVTVTVPAVETFVVSNVQSATVGTQTTITWSSTGSFSGSHFRISVKADTANLTPPSTGRSAIAASNASWTIASATNGTGSSGTLSSAGYVVVYNASNGKKSGSVTMNWNLAAFGTNVRSGNHQVTLRWRLESVP